MIQKKYDERKIPANALRLDCLFSLGDKQDKQTPFELFARSKQPVKDWYHGDIYHDFEGMKHNPTIIADYCHYETEVVGVGDKFNVKDDGLYIGGFLTHFREGDRADEIATKAKQGVPYEASIDFRGPDTVVEEVHDGYSATVNGESITGPALIVREWTLKGVAICPHGRDANSRAKFTEGDDVVVARFFTLSEDSEPMTTKTETTPESTPETETETPQVEGEATPETAPEATPETGSANVETQLSADARSLVTVELAKFTKTFGAENGSKWFSENKTYSQAMELHSQHLTKTLSERDATISQLTEKLKGLHHGEDTPAQFSEEGNPDGDGPTAPKHAIPRTFAESIKLPGKK